MCARNTNTTSSTQINSLTLRGLDPLRAALGKLDAAAEPTPQAQAPPPAKAGRAINLRTEALP